MSGVSVFLLHFFSLRSMGGIKLHSCRAVAEGPAAANILHFGTVNHTPRDRSFVNAKSNVFQRGMQRMGEKGTI